ncbi:hypothetical protein KUW04_08820 [Halomonas denitrificans]|nr:hypothetical protein [Halomonas denitrificans]
MKANTIVRKSLVGLSIDDLPEYFEKHGLQRLYTAKNRAFTFDVLDDVWLLDAKSRIYLNWMKDADISLVHYVHLRVMMANAAAKFSPASIRADNVAARKLNGLLHTSHQFQRGYQLLTDTYKRNITTIFNRLSKSNWPGAEETRSEFSGVIEFLHEVGPPQQHASSSLYSPHKGAYSEAENLEIDEKLRLEIESQLKLLSKQGPTGERIQALGTVIVAILMKSLFRRHCQWSQAKTSDILPINISFASHFSACHPNELPKEEFTFSDVEQLHVRVFRGKKGEFREEAEMRAKPIEPGLSQLLLIYLHAYKQCFSSNLNDQGIELSNEELDELFARCPLFPEESLAGSKNRFKFHSKGNLFKTLGHQSSAFHKAEQAFANAQLRLSKRLALYSERISDMNIGNNRIRHTVITNAIRSGKTAEQAAAITGVTTGAIRPYIDLSFDARLDIDQAFANNKVIQNFGLVSIEELQQQEGYKALDEFDREQGLILIKEKCRSCSSRLGIPLGCYGCSNFKPFIDGPHRENLMKAEAKLEANKVSKCETVRSLKRSILYIQATILLCEESKLTESSLNA